jgi:glycine cleavage system H protein
MKEIADLYLPKEARYTEDHEYAKSENEEVVVGINDYAQDQLGDIVYVELPQMGDTFEKGAQFGTVESVKAVAELNMPVGGEIIATNKALEDSPQLVNKSPYEDGWMIRVRANNNEELNDLMTNEAYLEMLKRIE